MRLATAARLAAAVAALVVATTLSAAPAECVPAKSCQPPPLSEFRKISITYGTELPQDWIDQYGPMLLHRFSKACSTHARCLTVWGNGTDFCRDNLKNDVFAECDSLFDRTTEQNNATWCRVFGDVFALGQSKAAKAIWEEAQACSRAKALAAGPEERRPQPRVVLEPKAPKPGQESWVVVKSFDADGDPLMGLVTIAGRERAYTFLPMRYGFEFHKEWDDDGRATLVAPVVVVTSPPMRSNGPPPFDPVTVAFETRPQSVRLEITPPVDKWKSGVNKVRVVAFDSSSGERVIGKLKTVGSILGPSDTTVEIRLEKGFPPCGTPVWFAADRAAYVEADLGVARCGSK